MTRARSAVAAWSAHFKIFSWQWLVLQPHPCPPVAGGQCTKADKPGGSPVRLSMSALGQKQTCASQNVMSALHPEADIYRCLHAALTARRAR
jgi:hypothetical protein